MSKEKVRAPCRTDALRGADQPLELITQLAPNSVDNPPLEISRQRAIVTLIDNQIACLPIGQDVLGEVAVLGPGMGLIEGRDPRAASVKRHLNLGMRCVC